MGQLLGLRKLRAPRASSGVVALLLSCSLLTACGAGQASDAGDQSASDVAPSPVAEETPRAGDKHNGHSDGVAKAQKPIKTPLRPGEKRTTLTVPAAYTPSAPNGAGTDDYRCFLLDPDLPSDAWLTGTNILPDNEDTVHHVILFRITADQVADAKAADADTPDPGWTCFGDVGVDGGVRNLDDASWLGAWAPGGSESLVTKGYGVELDQGSAIIMQVHYNLLMGQEPDKSSAQLRWRPRESSDLEALHTVLLPAPVELPCRPEYANGPLCTHDASVADAKKRFGDDAGQTANLLHLLCGTQVKATDTTVCTREVDRGMTIVGAAGHMHLLGTSIKIETNPGTPRAREVLNIPVWNFHDQSGIEIAPITVDSGDTMRVTCTHDQSVRDRLSVFEDTEEKYVVWGEGTTDEMCLGILRASFN